MGRANRVEGLVFSKQKEDTYVILVYKHYPSIKGAYGFINFWTFPGGKLEPDLSYKNALRLELYEETGLIPNQYKIIRILRHYNIKRGGSDYNFRLYLVNSKRLHNLKTQRLSENIFEVGWYPIEDAQALLGNRYHINAISMLK